MAKIEGGVKLKWGTLTKIARRRKLTANHVRLVANGERDGSKGLIGAILREFQKQNPSDPASAEVKSEAA